MSSTADAALDAPRLLPAESNRLILRSVALRTRATRKDDRSSTSYNGQTVDVFIGILQYGNPKMKRPPADGRSYGALMKAPFYVRMLLHHWNSSQ